DLRRGKGDILLFRLLFWPASRAHVCFQAKLRCDALNPRRLSVRCTSFHTATKFLKLGVALRLFHPADPVRMSTHLQRMKPSWIRFRPRASQTPRRPIFGMLHYAGSERK